MKFPQHEYNQLRHAMEDGLLPLDIAANLERVLSWCEEAQYDLEGYFWHLGGHQDCNGHVLTTEVTCNDPKCKVG